RTLDTPHQWKDYLKLLHARISVATIPKPPSPSLSSVNNSPGSASSTEQHVRARICIWVA
ncbi:hypothetical protein FRC19_005592, partial [Serendipita sp. 401]